jgi:hypothetical protein
MKKIIVIIAVMLIPFVASAKFNAGISVGYNATTLTSNWDNINSSLKGGLQVGIFARFGDAFFIQPELLYASRGGYAEFQDEVVQLANSGSEIHTGVFQIPVMLGIKLLNGDLLGVHAQAGPVMSLMTSKGIAGVDEVFSTKGLEDFSWGVQFGAGIDFMSFTLNIRYEYALSDIYNGSYGNTDFSAKANTFLVTLGWKLL